MNLFTKQKQTLSLRERTYGSQGERNRGRESQGVWDGHAHIAIFKMDNQQGSTVQHMEFCSMLCGSLDGRGDCERTDTCIYMAEILHCSPLFSSFYSAIYISMDSWIIILCLSYNPIVYYLFYCSTCSSFGLWELFYLAFVSL